MEESQSIRQADFAKVARAFCVECRGWKNARTVNDWGYPYIFENVSKELADTPIPAYRCR
jgi:hypothetical protein